MWIDAHMDSHTPATSHTGRLHGMPLAWLLGLDDDPLYGLGAGVLKPQHVCLVGVRSYEPEEDERLRKLGVRVVFMDEIRSRGIDAVLDEALDIATAGTSGFGVSIDLDVIEPEEAPHVGTPVTGGVTSAELARARGHRRRGQLAAIELVEYSPRLDHEGAHRARRGGSDRRAVMRAAPGCASPRPGARSITGAVLFFSRGKDSRQVEHALRAVAEEARVEVEQELVDAAFAHERAVQPKARLDVQLVHPAPRKLFQHPWQVDFLVSLGRTTTSAPAGTRPAMPANISTFPPSRMRAAAASPGGCRR